LIQDLNRLSFNSALDHLRKTNLPLDSSVKLVGPRVLHNSQWGLLDPIDTPDGGSIGLHKHLAISTYVTRGTSREPMIEWLRQRWSMKLIEEYGPRILATMTKVIVNGCWIGVVEDPLSCIEIFRLFRRNALIPIYCSATFDIERLTIFVYTDGGRLCRPIFYRDQETGRASYLANRGTVERLKTGDYTWTDLVTGSNKKRDSANFDPRQMKLYELFELYEGVETETNPAKLERFLSNKAILDYLDASESENALIAMNPEIFDRDLVEKEGTSGSSAPSSKKQNKSSPYTHCEIHNSLILGMMCNMIIFPENNPATRNSFSCGQSKQACSLYHTNYQVRMDKSAIVLNYGQTPLVKSHFLEHITHEENSYGENAIVAIACYTGYNVEDAMLINEGAIKRGLFRTSYFSCYEAHEETTQNAQTSTNRQFINIENEPAVLGTKPGYDYSKLDRFGLIREGTPVTDKTVLIGLASIGASPTGSAVDRMVHYMDESKTPKKGQLGIVDRTFITDGEAGQRIAKVRILEQRIPAIGDKMASRAGQKGTIGMVIPERDMPFTADGICPDIIINPHALPSRMTVGQLVECITGKACAMLGGFGNCTAFDNHGSKIGLFGELLGKQGYHSSGNEVLYNGMTGQQLEAEIFMGPTYYMRLKHMVKDKINYRALGPRTALTKQPVGGRANDGGLRIGEMERDTLISHGMSDFLRESMMERGDKSYVAICNHTGMISIYHPAKGIFMSPMADGPLQFTGSLESDTLRLDHVTKFGRSFSVICVPYSLKLMMQELGTIGMQMRIITEDTIKQMESMSYSDNLDRLLHKKDLNPKTLIDAIKQSLADKKGAMAKLHTPSDYYTPTPDEKAVVVPPYLASSPLYSPESMDNDVLSENNSSPAYDPTTPPYVPTTPPYVPTSPAYDPNTPPYVPTSPAYDPGSPAYNPNGDDDDDDDSPQYKPGGGGSPFQVGGRVLMRGVTDGHPTRPWSITHVGPKFMSIEAIDRSNLMPDQCSKIVSALDVFPEHELVRHDHVNMNRGNMMHGQTIDLNEMPYTMPVPSQPPTIINISPNLINGSGHTVTASNPLAETMVPNMVTGSKQDPEEFKAHTTKETGNIEELMQKGQALIIKIGT
jgi:DNA-directed RNA polymerase II subunit RPB2